MSREIKFRAWIDNELLSHEQLIDMDQETHAMYTIVTNEEKEDGISFMQYTGYKDKHGNEIFEGDIVQRVDDIPITKKDGTKEYQSWFVAFEYGQWTFVDTPISPASSYPSFYSNAQYMEVIGNIYENPELLEETA